jgi:hypothetical protein
MKLKLFLIFIFIIGVGLVVKFQFFTKEKETATIQNLELLFTCDVDGRIEPCGCFSGQMGGLSKIKTMVSGLNTADGLIFDIGNAIAGQEDYHVIQHKYILQAFHSIKYNAVNIGHQEALLPLASLHKIKQFSNDKSLPMLSANLRSKADQKLIFEPYTIITKGSKKFGVIGLISPKISNGSLDENVLIQEPRLAISEFISELDKKVDAIIVLGFLSTEEMEALADEFYEIDFILGGNVKESSQQLTKRNQSHIYYTTNKSRTLGQISFTMAPEIKINDQQINMAFPNIIDNLEIKKMSDEYRNEIRVTALNIDKISNNADFIPGVKNLNYYVGSESCMTCHESEYNIWSKTSHAKAFHSLQVKNSDADPTCIKCHTVGLGTESGYQRSFKDKKLINVGCENCHGPAGLHVDEFKARSKRVFKFNQVVAEDCTKCHYGEFSRPFNFNGFWEKIKHGKSKK